MEKRSSGDRITELPDSLLLHILSLLEMKEVVKTSVLSKNWEYIWTSVPTLTFDYCLKLHRGSTHHEVKKKIGAFVRWVSNTLLQCVNNTLRKLDIKFRYMKEFAGDVDLWAKFVARNKIKDMSLECTGNDYYKLPRSLCQNSSLSSLSISKCMISLGGEICWTSLTSLSIAWMILDENIMTKILSGTPMLQVLKISNCNSENGLNIYSNSLQELMIDSLFYGIFTEPLIEISAPNIQSLRILGPLFSGKVRLCSSSLFKAELDFQFEYHDFRKEHYMSQFMTIIESIRHVVQLEVGFYFLEALSLLGNNISLSSSFSRLTCLKLTGTMDKTDIVGIICLLKCSPNLEKLVVNKKEPDIFDPQRNKYLKKLVDEYWESERRMEKFDLLYLKTVKFNGFREVNEFTRILLLINLLRENAVLIDNLVIDIVKPKPMPV